jgi:hypothetical protein
MRRRMQLTVGGALIALGAGGLIWTGSLSQAAPNQADPIATRPSTR